MKNQRALFASMLGALTLLLSIGSAGLARPQPVAAEPAVDAKIEIVWPHDKQGNPAPVYTAPLVNVEVYLFERGTLNPVPKSFPNKVILRWARNFVQHGGRYEPAHETPDSPGSAVGQRVIRDVDGKTFPAWVFNDVPTQAGKEMLIPPTICFFVQVEGADYRTNVWAHSNYAPTFVVPPLLFVEAASPNPSVVDAYIQIVWPHDPQGNPRPVAEASLVNVGVDLIEHSDSTRAAAVNTPPWLLRSLNDGFLESTKAADQTIPVRAHYTGFTWQRWIFNDVDVSAAQDPLNKYYFAVQVEGVETHTTIWPYGADARTYFPVKDVPARSASD